MLDDDTDVSADDVKRHFESDWPTFVPLKPEFMKYKDQVYWGRTDKRPDAPYEVELEPDLIRALEAAQEVSNVLFTPWLLLFNTFTRTRTYWYG